MLKANHNVKSSCGAKNAATRGELMRPSAPYGANKYSFTNRQYKILDNKNLICYYDYGRPEAGQFGLSVLRALRLLRIFKVT